MLSMIGSCSWSKLEWPHVDSRGEQRWALQTLAVTPCQYRPIAAWLHRLLGELR